MRHIARQEQWTKSSRSGSGTDNCVEVFLAQGRAGMRDSKEPTPELWLAPGSWFSFTVVLKGGLR